MRRAILKMIAIVGYPLNFCLAWLCGGPKWFADHNQQFLDMWRGGSR